jgi:hypothetical protein
MTTAITGGYNNIMVFLKNGKAVDIRKDNILRLKYSKPNNNTNNCRNV